MLSVLIVFKVIFLSFAFVSSNLSNYEEEQYKSCGNPPLKLLITGVIVSINWRLV